MKPEFQLAHQLNIIRWVREIFLPSILASSTRAHNSRLHLRQTIPQALVKVIAYLSLPFQSRYGILAPWTSGE